MYGIYIRTIDMISIPVCEKPLTISYVPLNVGRIVFSLVVGVVVIAGRVKVIPDLKK